MLNMNINDEIGYWYYTYVLEFEINDTSKPTIF